jgi:hypothetical protein
MVEKVHGWSWKVRREKVQPLKLVTGLVELNDVGEDHLFVIDKVHRVLRIQPPRHLEVLGCVIEAVKRLRGEQMRRQCAEKKGEKG